jgi:hypothetical protein
VKAGNFAAEKLSLSAHVPPCVDGASDLRCHLQCVGKGLFPPPSSLWARAGISPVGRLTTRGVSKPLTLPFSLAITGIRASMSAAVALNRLALGVGQDQWQATDPASVTVTIALTATRAP